jgi:chaperonin GroES
MARGASSTMTFTLRPLGDRVVVRAEDDLEQRTPSGLVIPDTAKEKPQIGEVLAVGPGALNDEGERLPMDVSTGDRVLYSKYAGTEVKLDGKEYLVLSARDVLAIVG